MADRHTHRGGRTILPPVHSILSGMNPCRHPGCIQVFDSVEKQYRHEQTCESRQAPSFTSVDAYYRECGRMPSMHTQALPLRTSFDAPSPPSAMSDITDSDESSSCVFTPGTSRANSVSIGSDGRRPSGAPERTNLRYARRARNPSPHDAPQSTGEKAKKKQQKEKQNRSNQAAVLWRVEDFLRNYCGWERKEQSGGNGNGAGLHACKINVLRGEEALLYHFLHKERCRALVNGTVDEFERECAAILDSAAEEKMPYRGTFLYGEQDVPCGHSDTKSKGCVVHGHPDWRECRRVQMERRFRVGEGEFLREASRRG